ncbi:MAG: hypothetical protein TRG1_311 [Flavobacteriaceae bacterium FS1-H7996/R]|nr:MAG: hypothetical protein TRG1_311 [Flavobacteriaceae bacterium FS1-H7996/R]
MTLKLINTHKPFDCAPNNKYLQKQNPPLKKIKDGKKIAMKKKNITKTN